MNDLKTFEDLFKDGLPSNLEAGNVEDELRRYLRALKQKNETNRNDALENLKFLFRKKDAAMRGGIPGEPQKNIDMPPKIIELYNETIHSLQLESIEKNNTSSQNAIDSTDQNAKRDKDN